MPGIGSGGLVDEDEVSFDEGSFTKDVYISIKQHGRIGHQLYGIFISYEPKNNRILVIRYVYEL